MTIRSLSIGQGEILETPLQMANLCALIANGGFYCPPHTVRSNKYEEVVKTDVEKKYFDLVTEGMSKVVESGTARIYGKIPGIDFCGKTGTVENPPHKTHSMFMGFAPRENPKIAIAVVVENSGGGATWAVPVASLIVEQYLTGKIGRKWVEDHVTGFNIY
jgi:penicillin-binding protein 2